MENSSGFGGSRSEFLPGERYDDSDIKYHRHGGCFVSHKRAFVYVLMSASAIIVAAGLVYFYAPRWKDRKINVSDETIDSEALIELLKPETITPKVDGDTERAQKNILPIHYELFIQPHLREISEKNITFEGNVSIKFYVKKPTKQLLFDAEMEIIDPLIVSYQTSAKPKGLKSASQVLEGSLNTTDQDNTTSGNSTAVETVVEPIATVEIVNNTVSNNTELNNTVDQPTSSSEAPVVSPSTSTAEPKVELPELPVEATSAKVPSSTSSAAPVATESTTSTSTTSTSTTVATSTTAAPVHESVDVPSDLNLVGIRKADIRNGYLKLFMDVKLKPDVIYTINIKFKGKVEDKNGLVKYSFQDEETGNFSWGAVTSLYPDHAKKVFPCIDQLWYKAKYQVNVARETSRRSLSNMPINISTPHKTDSGWIWDTYEETPEIPVHSVAFVVHGSSSKQVPSEPGTIMNIWGRKDLLKTGSYIQEIAPKLLNFYNIFFGYHYPLPKLDIAVVPNLFAESSDNFGLILFSEDITQVDKQTPHFAKEILLNHVAFSFARQWLKGIVTLENREDTWISEGLATYMQYLGMNNVEPTWELSYNFATMIQDVLRTDSQTILKNHHFDEDMDMVIILRKKACSIMRMLNNSMTDSIFIQELRTFIDSWKYKAAEPSSLWNGLGVAGQKGNILPKDFNVNDMIDAWTNGDGFPFIWIERNYGKGFVEIQQVSYGGRKEDKPTWILPLNYITSETQDMNLFSKLWVKDLKKQIDNLTLSSENWILFNVFSTTPCRINYDNKNWFLLTKQLLENPEVIPPINRAQLIDDAFQLAKMDLLDYKIVLNLTNYLKNKERHYLPWLTALRNFEEIFLILYKSPEFEYFQDYLLNIITPIYFELGLVTQEIDTHLVSSLRSLIINWACKLNYKPCVDHMYSQYQIWANFTNPEETHQMEYELRGTMYCVGVQQRGRRAWDFLWEKFSSPNIKEEEKIPLIQGLGCTQNAWLLAKYFKKTLKTSKSFLKIIPYVWNTLPYDFAIHEAFEYLRENWIHIYKLYKPHSNIIKEMITGVLSKLNTKNELNEVTRFFFAHDELKPYTKYLAKAARVIKDRLTWKEKYLYIFTENLKLKI